VSAHNDRDDDDNRELPDELHQRIVKLSERANQAIDGGKPAEAIDPLNEALDLLPPLEDDWDAWTWLNATLGDAYFAQTDYKNAKIALFDALSGPDGNTNPFILLPLGESLFELGEHAQARRWLAQAHMLEGDALFAQEPAHYLRFLREQ